MNRLVVRLMVAMLLVALVSFVATPLAEMIAARSTLASLPDGFRQRVLDRTTPHLFLGTRPSRPSVAAPPPGEGAPGSAGIGAPPDGAQDRSLAVENDQLFVLLGSFRAAQQRAVLIGTAASLLVGLLLALAFSRNIAVPFESLTRAAARIANGEFGTRVTLRVRRRRSQEARQLTDAFNAMAASLEGYERERNAMIADIAHELRTPLATLQMRLDALHDGLVPFDRGEAELLLQHAALLSRLVEDLKMLSLADSGRLSLRFEEVELGSWLESVTEVLRDAARRCGSSLEVNVPADAIPVRADVDRLLQVARNLVDNAAEAMAEGGEVVITLRREGAEAVLAVRDRGPGIDPADLDSIFERFAQGGRRDARTGVGRGLGLAVVRSLVRLHGGTVTAANRDVGAEITVRLPI